MSEISEKIGSLTAKVDAAHKRVDKIEADVRDNLKELSKEMKELNAHMNKGRGWAAAVLLAAGLIGGGLVNILINIFNK